MNATEKYELLVDNEWIYEGSYETCSKMAANYWDDIDEVHSISIMTENEFYGYNDEYDEYPEAE